MKYHLVCSKCGVILDGTSAMILRPVMMQGSHPRLAKCGGVVRLEEDD